MKLTKWTTMIGVLAFALAMSCGDGTASDDKKACSPKTIETNSFRKCYPNTMSEADITAAEEAEYEGLFRDACEAPCELVVEIVLAVTTDACQDDFGSSGRWVDVTYTIKCE